MDEMKELGEAILNLTKDGLLQLIEFLQTQGPLDEMSNTDIRNVSLMREGWMIGKKSYFGSADTCGPAVGKVLLLAKSPTIGREKVLGMLEDNKRSLDQMNG